MVYLKEAMPTKIEISHKTIIFTLVLIAAVWLVLQIRDILFLLFISFILMSALRPIVDGMSKLRIPRFISILLLYGLIFGGLGAGVLSMIPTLSSQSSKLFTQLPEFLSRIFPYISSDVRSLLQQAGPVGENLLRVTVGVFSNAIAVVTVMTFTFYFLLERKHLENFLAGFLGGDTGSRVFTVLLQIEKRLGAWVLGQVCLMIFIGLLVYGGLFFLRVEYALPLAIFAGILEIVPTIGPTVSAIPAILVAFGSSPILALSVAALYIIVQQIENNLLVPLVMKQSVGLPPVLTILALMIGAKFGGVAGAVLAVPVLISIQEIVNSLPVSSKGK